MNSQETKAGDFIYFARKTAEIVRHRAKLTWRLL
jgi:hypothetical protein